MAHEEIRHFMRGGGLEENLLGTWQNDNYNPPRTVRVYWIGLANEIGVESSPGDRMVISINNTRAHSDRPGSREIIAKFDKLVEKHFPPRKQLVRRGEGTPTGRIPTTEPQLQNLTPRTEEGTRIRKAFERDLLGQSSGVVSGEQPGTQNIAKDGEQRPLLRKRGSPS